MKKKPEMKSMTPLGALYIWPEMVGGKDWEDKPLSPAYQVSEKGRQELARWHQRKRNSKVVIAWIITIVLIALTYYACFYLKIFG